MGRGGWGEEPPATCPKHYPQGGVQSWVNLLSGSAKQAGGSHPKTCTIPTFPEARSAVSNRPVPAVPLQCVRRQPRGSAPLRALSESLRRVLAEWFSVGLLQLRRLTWEGTPAALLEKVRPWHA